jgi:hypothetical protein
MQLKYIYLHTFVNAYGNIIVLYLDTQYKLL